MRKVSSNEDEEGEDSNENDENENENGKDEQILDEKPEDEEAEVNEGGSARSNARRERRKRRTRTKRRRRKPTPAPIPMKKIHEWWSIKNVFPPSNINEIMHNVFGMHSKQTCGESMHYYMDEHLFEMFDNNPNYDISYGRLPHIFNETTFVLNQSQVEIWPIPQKFKLFRNSIELKVQQMPNWYSFNDKQNVQMSNDGKQRRQGTHFGQKRHSLKWKCNLGEDIFESNEMFATAIDRYELLMFEHTINPPKEEIENEKEEYYFDTIYVEFTKHSNDKEYKFFNSSNIPGLRDLTIKEEEYSIVIPYKYGCNSIFLFCESSYAFLRAIETLSQLIHYNFETNVYEIKYHGYIHDYPSYSYRGVLLDTSRHFHPPKIIKHFLDSMTYAKFNVFHWHMIDDQSFPFPIKSNKYQSGNISINNSILEPMFLSSSNPNSAYYSKQEIYSINDMLDIIHYANIRGIRVLPEFDMPGHTHSWCKLFDICVDTHCTEATYGLLDFSQELTLPIVDALYREFTAVFSQQEYIHIGLDEVRYQCYYNSSRLYRWVYNNIDNVPPPQNMDTFERPDKRLSKRSKRLVDKRINLYFFKKIINIVKGKYKKKIIVWDDIWHKLQKGIQPSDAILMVWRGDYLKRMKKMLNNGFDIILTAPYYLDRTYENLNERYYGDIHIGVHDKPHVWPQILGGQACVWSERIDASVLDAKMWMDAAVVGENLWLGTKVRSLTNWEMVKKRLKWFRCTLLRRGIGASFIEFNRTGQEVYWREPQSGSCFEE